LHPSLEKPCFERFVGLEVVVKLVGLDGSNVSQSTQAPFLVQICTTGSSSSLREQQRGGSIHQAGGSRRESCETGSKPITRPEVQEPLGSKLARSVDNHYY
jgi:hypothetical protein